MYLPLQLHLYSRSVNVTLLLDELQNLVGGVRDLCARSEDELDAAAPQFIVVLCWDDSASDQQNMLAALLL